MPRVAIPVTEVRRSGVALSLVASDATNDHYFMASGLVVLYVRNTGTTAALVEIPLTAAPDGQAVAPRQVSVPAGEDRYIGPFPTRDYLQSDGSVYVNVNSADLSLGVLKVG